MGGKNMKYYYVTGRGTKVKFNTYNDAKEYLDYLISEGCTARLSVEA